MSDKKDWYLVLQNPVMYAYGYLAGSEICEISATVERLENGSWRWRLKKWTMQGIEPSAETAKQAALKFLDNEKQAP